MTFPHTGILACVPIESRRLDWLLARRAGVQRQGISRSSPGLGLRAKTQLNVDSNIEDVFIKDCLIIYFNTLCGLWAVERKIAAKRHLENL